MRGFDLRSSGAGAKAAAATVPASTTGVVATIPTGLKAPITVARESGSTAITFAASGNRITASIASALAVGASLSAIARAVQADGAGVLVPVMLTGIAGGGGAVLPSFSAALARILSGSGRAVHGVVGDSVTAGHGANIVAGAGSGAASGSTDYKRANSYPHQIAEQWIAAGVPARSDAIWGNGMTTNQTIAEYQVADSNVTFGAGWAVSSTDTIGGRSFANGSTANALVFTPEFAADRFDLWVIDFTDGGAFSVTDSSGTIATDTTLNGSARYRKITVTRTINSTAPISLIRSAGILRVCAIVPWSVATPRLEVWNMGYGGAGVATQLATTNLWSPGNAFDAVIATGVVDLWTVMQGINDKGGVTASVPVATYQANLTSLLTKFVGGGKDVLMAKEHKVPAAPSYDLDATWLAAIDAAVAAVPSVRGIIDVNGMSPALGAGDYYDAVHLAGQGAGKVATVFRTRIAALAG